MKPRLLLTRPLTLAGLAILLSIGTTLTRAAAADAPMTAGEPILIPDSHGKFDFIEVDAGASRLLVSHPGNARLDVFDLESGKLIKHAAIGVAQDVAIDEKGGK